MDRLKLFLLRFVFTVFLPAYPAFSQVPILDPEKTVNLSTGEMGFSMPLGVVRGINNHDYHITLNYRAGIKLNDDASAVGLGFSYEPGGITKRDIFVNDENHGGESNYQQSPAKDADEEDDIKIVKFIFTIVETAVSFIPGVGTALSIVVGMAQTAYTSVAVQSPGISAGGSHLPGYQGLWGQGFFQPDGDADAPDMYFVNTPFISGQMVWTGDAATGHFVMKTTGGSGRSNSATTIIKRTIDAEGFSVFEIDMNDGTRLFFDKHDEMSRDEFFWRYRESGDFHLCYGKRTQYKEKVPQNWRLTKVLFNDYIDGGNDLDPLNSLNTNKGGWICFKYDSIDAHIKKPWMISQAGEQRAVYEGPGYPNGIKIFYLKSIITPNDSAEYVYSWGRKDNVWIWEDLRTPYSFPVLSAIKIHTKQGAVIRTIQFNTDYSLRPNTFSTNKFTACYMDDWWLNHIDSFSVIAGNENGCALTLDSLRITDLMNRQSNSVVFSYGANPPAYEKNAGGGFKHSSFAMDNNCNDPPLIKSGNSYKDRYWFIEQKDLWGYYCPNSGTTNDFNQAGLKERECAPDANETPYAAAWSLIGVTFTNGLSIEWTYESQRYDRVNGIEVHSNEASPPRPRYGGGIRVKQVKCNNGLSGAARKSETWSYFYTSSPTDFSETTGGYSGYATFDPYDYLHNTDYRVSPLTKGGLYTPGVVAYEQVKVAKNYRTSAPHTPNGYAVYYYNHSGDSTIEGYYPNLGPYGDVDYSWKRGLLLSVKIYNKNDRCIQKQKNSFAFNQEETIFLNNNDIIPADKIPLDILNERIKNTVGWTRIAKDTATENGVSKPKEFKYALDLPGQSPDKIDTIIREVKRIARENNTYMYKGDYYNKIATVLTKSFGPDPTKHDLLVALWSNSFGNLCSMVSLYLVSDIDLMSTPLSYRSIDRIKNMSCGDGQVPQYFLTGMDIVNIPGAGDADKPELVFELTADANHGQYLNYYILNDVTEEKLRDSTYFNNDHFYTALVTIPAELPRTDFTYLLSASTIGDLNNNGQPDIIYFNHFKGAGRSKKLWALLDMRMSGHSICFEGGNCSLNSTLHSTAADIDSLIIPVGNIRWNLGTICKFVVLGSDNLKNDLVFAKGNGSINDPDYSVVLKALTNVRMSDDIIQFDSVKSINTYTFNSDHYLNFNDMYNTPADLFSMDFINDKTDSLYYTLLNPDHPDGYYNPIEWYFFNHLRRVTGDFDGQPNRIIETNSDATKRISIPTPAYWKPVYAGMASASHQLTPTCQTTVYQGDPPVAANAVSSKVTTWQSVNGVWLPQNSFVWEVPLSNTTGLPTAGNSLVDFDFTGGAVDGRWKSAGGVTKYSANSNPIEVKNSLNIVSSTVYGTHGNLPVGSISPANFYESGVFTCDYDLNETGSLFNYFDKQNGWEKDAGSIVSDYSHFGQKCLKILNGQGVMRCFKVRPNQAYKLSGWVNVPNGPNSLNIVVEYWTGPNPVITWPIQWTDLTNPPLSSFITSVPPTSGNWQFVKIPIPARTEANLWIRIHFGIAGQNILAYVDDIRFGPSKAQISTTYYDTLWQQPKVTVDANNNPGDFVNYDNFGRPVEVLKIDKSVSRGWADQVLQRKRYHLMNEPAFPDPTKFYKIISRANPQAEQAVEVDGGVMAPNTNVSTFLYMPANNWYRWKFVAAENGYYNIVSQQDPDYALDVLNGTMVNNGNVQIFNASVNNPNQLWKVIEVGDGCYELACKNNPGFCLHANSPVPSGVTNVDIFKYTAGYNQQWKIVEAQ